MGYYSHLSGSIDIQPPLNYSEIKSIGQPSYLSIEEEREVTDNSEGTTTVVRGVALIPRWEDSAKYYGVEEDLERLAAGLATHTFSGWLVREGEEQGDVQRYTIRDGRVVSEKASMTWPDGTVAP